MHPRRLLLPLLLASAPALAQGPLWPGYPDRRDVYQDPAGNIIAVDERGTQVFDDWADFHRSRFFLEHGMRCGAHDRSVSPGGNVLLSPGDCDASGTNAAAAYDPGGGALYRIPVVVHILRRTNGVGDVSDARVQSQIDVLNEDFNAIAGSPGAPGTNGKIEFYLATTDPNGAPSTGINRYSSNSWHNDKGTYYNQIGWDTNRYLNIYVNSAGGNLGYAYLPSGGGVVGQPWDGVRVFYRAFGRNTGYAPYDQGRTTTHEVGHYFGLYHTFQGGCDSGGCATSGDLVCDTNSESSPFYGCGSRVSCGSSDPTTNYMDYSEDACMFQFTPIQVNRMRCTLENFRVDLADGSGGGGGGGGGTPPDAATSPSPADGSTGVATTPLLTWSAATGAESYDVYFGSSPSLGSGDLQGNQTPTSWSPGTLAAGTTWYWRIDSVGSGGTTTGATWSFTTEAGGGGGGGGDLLNEDFESGALTGWVTTGTVQVNGNGAYQGSNGMVLRRTASAERALDASGRTGVTLSYARRTSNYDSGEALTVEWFDGSSWTVLETVNSNSWQVRTWALGPGADNNPSLHIRFRGGANRNNEQGRIDSVVVTAD